MSSAASPRADLKAGAAQALASSHPEFNFLVACTSRSHDLSISEPVNWDRLVHLAQHHGVVPQLSRALEHSSHGVPPEVVEKVLSENRVNTRQALWLTRELFRILEQLKSRNVDALPYKGPVLAELLYGNVAARQFHDIDVFIHSRDLPVAIAALHELGYEPGIELTPRQQAAYLRSGYEYTFDGEHGRNLVELQWNILPQFYSVELKTEGLFDRSRVETLSGRAIQTLCPEDLLIVLCLHAAKHGWVQLSWLSDVGTLAASESLDWEAVRERSLGLGIERTIGVTLALCRHLWGTSFPFPRPFQCELLLREQLEMLADGREFDTESIAYIRRMLEVRERRRDRMRFIWRLATTASVGEWSAIRLPSPLFPLYGTVRAVRIVKRMLTTRW
jgi:hypothetical protein